MGSAVNISWELTLKKVTSATEDALRSRVLGTTSGSTNLDKGVWGGQLYRDAGKRLSGAVGNFNGKFTDG